MSELLTQPGFEAAGDWTLTAPAVFDAGAARSGSLGVALGSDGTAFPITSGSVQQTVAVEPGVALTVSAWGRRQFGSATLLLNVDDELLASSTGTVGEWVQLSGTVTPAAATITVQIKALSPTDASEWHVDDASVDDGVEDIFMAKTATIKAALLADLQYITTGHGFSLTVAETGTEPKPVSEVSRPAVWITTGGGGAQEIETLGNQSGLATQEFTLQLVASSKDEIDNLLDDVRNAIERSSSNTHAVANVEMAGVSGWDMTLTDTGVAEGVYVREATVEVRYLFTRGAA